MKKCKNCQKEIDEKAKKCPFCQSDLRSWFSRHPILTGIGIFFGLAIVVRIAGGNSSQGLQSSQPFKSGNQVVQQGAASGSTDTAVPTSGPTSDDLMKQNNPDIKHLSTLTADYVGKSFTLYVNAKVENYYNYGFSDQNSYYSLKLWDNSVNGDYDGIYGYIDRSDPNSKILVNQILNGTTFLKVSASIPTDKYVQSSNAFLQINKWEEVK